MGRKFWAIFGILLTLGGLYNYTKDGALGGVIAGVICLGIAAYMKDSEF